jgi:hypothetical protein
MTGPSFSPPPRCSHRPTKGASTIAAEFSVPERVDGASSIRIMTGYGTWPDPMLRFSDDRCLVRMQSDRARGAGVSRMSLASSEVSSLVACLSTLVSR